MRLFELNRSDTRPVYRQIVDEIQRCVAVGMLRTDEALPAARAMASELGVNVNTVQHAYRELERDGTVYVKRGLGTFVSLPPKEPRHRQAAAARRLAEQMLREGFRHGLLASDLIKALEEIAPKK